MLTSKPVDNNPSDGVQGRVDDFNKTQRLRPVGGGFHLGNEAKEGWMGGCRCWSMIPLQSINGDLP